MFISCATINKGIDRYSLYKTKKGILKDFNPGNAEELGSYISGFNLDKLTAVDKNTEPYSITPLGKWHISSGRDLTYEKWSFKSSFFGNSLPGDALFYAILQSKPENSPVILWVPGFGVSDFAFRFIRHFFTEQIDAGYNVVIYIPPYHMERQSKGKSPGNGLVTASPLHNVKEMVNAVKELRMVYTYLKNRKAASISTWGGSMGGAFTLMLQSVEKVDSMGLMIPVLDWNTFITPEELLPKYTERGFTPELLKAAYSLISPETYPLKVPPQRIQIEAAEYDQLTPVETIAEYCKDRGIENFKRYRTGHAAILMDKKVYSDYGDFLSGL